MCVTATSIERETRRLSGCVLWLRIFASCFRACRANVVYDARLVPFVSRSLSDARGRPRMATNDGNGPFGALAEFFSPSRPASAPLDAQTDHNNTAHNNPANISPVNLDMSSGSGTEPDHDASAHPSARDKTTTRVGHSYYVQEFLL